MLIRPTLPKPYIINSKGYITDFDGKTPTKEELLILIRAAKKTHRYKFRKAKNLNENRQD